MKGLGDVRPKGKLFKRRSMLITFWWNAPNNTHWRMVWKHIFKDWISCWCQYWLAARNRNTKQMSKQVLFSPVEKTPNSLHWHVRATHKQIDACLHSYKWLVYSCLFTKDYYRRKSFNVENITHLSPVSIYQWTILMFIVCCSNVSALSGSDAHTCHKSA